MCLLLDTEPLLLQLVLLFIDNVVLVVLRLRFRLPFFGGQCMFPRLFLLPKRCGKGGIGVVFCSLLRFYVFFPLLT